MDRLIGEKKNHILFSLNIFLILVLAFLLVYESSFSRNISFQVQDTLAVVEDLLLLNPQNTSSREEFYRVSLNGKYSLLREKCSLLHPHLRDGILLYEQNCIELYNPGELKDHLTYVSLEIRKNFVKTQKDLKLYSRLVLLSIVLLFAFHCSLVSFWKKRCIGFLSQITDSFESIKRLAINQRVLLPEMEEPSEGCSVSPIQSYTSKICDEILFERSTREIDIHGDLDQVLIELCHILRQRMECDRIGIAFFNRNGELSSETTYISSHGIHYEPDFSRRINSSFLENLLKEKGDLIIHNLAEYAEEHDVTSITGSLIQSGMRSCLITPIRFSNHYAGFVTVLSRKKGVYDAEKSSHSHRIMNLLKHKLYMEYILQHVVAHTSQAFMKLVLEKDNETSGHIRRMSRYSYIIGCRYIEKFKGSVPVKLIREIRWFSSLHDIGKVGIPDHILKKPGKLNDEERELMKQHVTIGENVIREISDNLSEYFSLPMMETAVDIIRGHHEKYDGSGYPRGLAGTEIPLAGRIVALADVFDALTSKRTYKKAYSPKKAIQIIENEMEGHFDPEVLSCFLESLDEIKKIYESHKEV